MPLISDGKIILTHYTNQNRFKSLADVDKNNIKIITNPGGTNEEFVTKHIKNAMIIIENNIELIFKKLAANEVDVLITDRIEALYRQSINKNLLAVSPEHPLTTNFKGFMLRTNNQPLKEEIDIALVKMLKNNEIKNIFNKHFNFPLAEICLIKSLSLNL